jgi:4-hydroxy-3-methylbut-2-enyl diphosphate reductase IspH
VSELKNKFNRKPDQTPPKKKGNAEVISKLVHNDDVNTVIKETVNIPVQESVNTEKKKATFVLDAGLHKRLRMFAVENDTTMVDIVEKAINEYMDRMGN